MKSMNVKVFAIALLFSIAAHGMERPQPAITRDASQIETINAQELLKKIKKEVFGIIALVKEGLTTAHKTNKIPNASALLKTLKQSISLLPASHPLKALLMKFYESTLACEQTHYSSGEIIKNFTLVSRDIKQHINSLKTCDICFDENLSIQLSCGHEYCLDCLSEHIKARLSENDCDIKCPSRECKKQIEQKDIQELMRDPKVMQKIDTLQLKRWLASQKNVKHCPTANCNFSFINEKTEQHTMRCPECKKDFCGLCAFAHSRNITCKEAEENRNTTTNASAAEKATEQWKKNNTKPCPRCNATIEKNDGCNHMTCSKCRHEFCWLCSGNWRGHTGCPLYGNRDGSQQVQAHDQQPRERLDVYYNGARLFAADPYGVMPELQRQGMRLPDNFLEQFMRLSCEQQQTWVLFAEEFTRQSQPADAWIDALEEITTVNNPTLPKQITFSIISATPVRGWSWNSYKNYAIGLNLQGITRNTFMQLFQQHRNHLEMLIEARMNNHIAFDLWYDRQNNQIVAQIPDTLTQEQMQSALDQFNEYMRDVLAHQPAAPQQVPRNNFRAPVNNAQDATIDELNALIARLHQRP
jgi:hypothetical protein